MTDDVNPTPTRVAIPVLDDAFARVAELARLESNWDAQGSEVPSPDVIALARRVLLEAGKRFEPEIHTDVQPYAVAPMSGGGVYLDWRSEHAELEVIIGPGELGYLFVDKSDPERRFEEADDVDMAIILDRLSRVLNSRLRELRGRDR